MRATCLATLALLGPAAAARDADASSDRAPRWLPTKSVEHSCTFAERSDRVVLKLADDAGARAVGGRLDLAGARLDLVPLGAVMQRFPGVRVQPLIGQSSAVLDELRARGEARGRVELADLTQYFALDLPAHFPTRDLVAALLALDVVENAYVQPPPGPPPGDVAPTTPDFTPQQGYRGPAPVGIDVDHAQLYVVGDGAGVTMVDVEFGWNFDHEDLVGIDASAALNTDSGCWSDDHGTAVLGEIIGDPDGSGVTGLAPGVDMKVVSTLPTDCYTLEIANALMIASAALSTGDVILIEQQLPSPNWETYHTSHVDQFGMVPVEYFDAEFNAIRLITALGIHVVEAAGNGEQDLDSASPPNGHATYPARFDLAQRDSGAVLVAAGTAGLPKLRRPSTNYGSRIDAFAWGELIMTTGYGPSVIGNPFPAGDFDKNQWYRSNFGGTSGASPMVASAVAIIEAVHVSAHGHEYSTTAMRGLLRTVGTPNDEAGMSLQPDLAGQLPRVGAGALLNLFHLAPHLEGNLFPRPFYDMNGDGTGDWLVGQFEDPPEGLEPQNPGNAMAMDGLTGEVLFQWSGAFAGDDFGAFVGALGDWNADGEPDAFVGAPGGYGQLLVFSGADGGFLFSFDGDTEDERFGHVACALPDIDDDLVPDFAVAAPDGAGQNPQSGRVLLFSGASGDLLGILGGGSSGERFGEALALVHDVDGLGLPDLAVGAPGGAPGAGEGELAGRVVLFSMETGAQLDELKGPEAGARFGHALAFGPDANGDGLGDLAVGAPGAANGRGDVTLHALPSPDGGPAVSLGSAFASAPGEDGDELGLALHLIPDRDGDGTLDLVVGAPGSDALANDGGSAYVVSWATGAIVAKYHGVFDGNRFGTVVAGGDLDGDGVGDVLAASDGLEGTSATAGAYVFLGAVGAAAPVPDPPTLTAITPAMVEAVSADGGTVVQLSGTNLETATRVVLDGQALPSTAWSVSGGAIVAALPLAGQLGTVDVEVHTLGGVAVDQIAIIANAAPTLALAELGGPFLPMLEDVIPKGAVVTTGSQPGDVALLLVSRTLAPSAIPGLFDADIGGGLTDLYLLATAVVPAQGWSQVAYPELPSLGSSYALYFQALVIDGQTLAFPAEASNVQALTVD